MMIRHRFRDVTRVRLPAVGVLLLALPLCGLALRPAQAQPAANPPTALGGAPFTSQQNAEIERVMSVARYEEFCKSALDLQLKDATIEEISTRIKAAFPSQQVEIRQRDAHPIKISIDSKETTVATVLSSVAALADCKLWVLPDGLLIAPLSKLNPNEKELVEKHMAGNWAENLIGGGHGWSSDLIGRKIFAIAVAQEVKANGLAPNEKGVVKTTFAKFSPQSQDILRQMANWSANESSEYKPFILAPDSPVSVDTAKPGWVTVDLRGGSSDPYSDRYILSTNIAE